MKKAVCLHEEDVGLLWKHMEYRTGYAESRRSRRLVFSFTSTVVNYEYGLSMNRSAEIEKFETLPRAQACFIPLLAYNHTKQAKTMQTAFNDLPECLQEILRRFI